MKDEKLIYVRLEKNEAVQSKRDILESQLKLLQVLQIMKRYYPLRINELKIKSRFSNRIKDISRDISKLQTTLPQIKMPKIIREHYTPPIDAVEEIKSKAYDSNLESQLQDIQAKLKELSE